MTGPKDEIALIPFTESDIDLLLEWVPSAEFMVQWSGPQFRFPLDREIFRRHLARAKGDRPLLLAFKAVNRQTGQAVGYGELANIDYSNKSAYLARILIGPKAARGQGYGGQLVEALLEIAFLQLRLHRVALNVYDFNQAAIRCYEKAGFTNEGIRRDGTRFKNQYWSSYAMSILENEWRRSKERWNG